MKKILISLTLILFTFYMNAQEHTLPLVTTQGSATIYVAPDEALISFSIVSESDDLQDARDQNASLSKKAMTYLKNKDVEEKHIQTQYLNIGINYRHQRDQREKKYMATQQFSVCVKDLETLESIITGLIEMEVSNLGTPMFRSSEIQDHKQKAKLKAVVNAMNKAKLFAEELGQTIGKAYRITEISYGSPMPRMGYRTMAADMSAEGMQGGDSFAQGQIEVKASIEVSFYLE